MFSIYVAPFHISHHTAWNGDPLAKLTDLIG